jgi:hypothetical protein
MVNARYAMQNATFMSTGTPSERLLTIPSEMTMAQMGSQAKTQSNRSVLRLNTFSYIPALDGLRFLAFFLVFLHHTLPIIVIHDPVAIRIRDLIQHRSWIGVDLFFILSGFLITSILLDERNSFDRFYVRKF